MKLCLITYPVTSPVDKRSYPMIAITSMARWSLKSLVLSFVPEQEVKKMLFSCLSAPGFVVFVSQSSDSGSLMPVSSKLVRVAEGSQKKAPATGCRILIRASRSLPLVRVFGLFSAFLSFFFCHIHNFQPGTLKSKQQIGSKLWKLFWSKQLKCFEGCTFSIFLYILYTIHVSKTE